MTSMASYSATWPIEHRPEPGQSHPYPLDCPIKGLLLTKEGEPRKLVDSGEQNRHGAYILTDTHVINTQKMRCRRGNRTERCIMALGREKKNIHTRKERSNYRETIR